MNPDKISNDKTVEINLQPSTYFSLTWRGLCFSLGSQKREVCEPRNRRPKEKERFSEPQLNWEECSVPTSDPVGWSGLKELETQKESESENKRTAPTPNWSNCMQGLKKKN